MNRFCQRCRTWRLVDWRSPGSATHCAPCSEELAAGRPTDAEVSRRARAKQSRARRLYQFKRSLCCRSCGEDDPDCLDCYRTAADTRTSRLVKARLDRPLTREELEACVVLCANCARKERKLHRDDVVSSKR